MPRNVMVSYYDWGQDPGASISGGSWEPQMPPERMLTIQPQRVAQAVGSSVSFNLDLGATRLIGAVHLQHLVADPNGSVTVAGFSAGPQPVLPVGMDALTFAALGRQRVFIPDTPQLTSSIPITIVGGTTPLQIGYVGACEMVELAVNMDYGWKYAILDESEVSKVPFGSTYVTLRARRRQLNLGVGFLLQGGYYAGRPDELFAPFDAAVIAGRSFPILVAPQPDDAANLERTAVWGLSTTDQEFANPFFATWSTAYQVEQLA